MRSTIFFSLPFLLLLACGPGTPEALVGDDDGAPVADDPTTEWELGERCQRDADCSRGVCSPTSKRCVHPWALECAGVLSNRCSPTRPYVCQGDRPPKYDCVKCGCPSGETCTSGVCLSNTTLALRRNDRAIPNNLPVGDYFRLTDAMSSNQAQPYAKGTAEVVRRLRVDARRTVLNLGESHGSADEQAVALQLVRDVVNSGFSARKIGIEGASPILDATPLADLGIRPFSIVGDLTNNAYCSAATKEAGLVLNSDRLYVQYSGSGHSSQEVCQHVQHYPICQPPHTAECVAKTGRKAVTVILFDPKVWLGAIDRTLIWRAGDKLPDVAAYERELSSLRERWEWHLALQRRAPEFDATVSGRTVNVRFVPSPRFDDVLFAYFPRPDFQPFSLRTHLSLWNHPSLRAFMTANDIRPKNCSISWGGEPATYGAFCSRAGRELSATLDAAFTVTEWSTR